MDTSAWASSSSAASTTLTDGEPGGTPRLRSDTVVVSEVGDWSYPDVHEAR